MESKILNIPPISRADSQPSPQSKLNAQNESTEQKSDENNENQIDSNGKSQQHGSNDNSAKHHARTIKDIRGILKGKMKQRTFVVLFADSEKEETVPIAQMHKYYLKELLDFYEAHITKGAQVPVNSTEKAQDTKPTST